MTINVLQAAKCLGQMSSWRFSNLELQKIIYICHMLYLGQEKRPLVEGNFQAWDYGPVHPKLYHRLKRFGSSSIDKSALVNVKSLKIDVHGNMINTLKEAFEHFPPGSGPKLVAITHWEKGAWAKNYAYGMKDLVISNDDIQEEYKERQKEKLQNQIQKEN